MMFFHLLASVLLHFAIASDCPSPVKMYVSQDSLVSRPTGAVVLTCVVTGLGDDDVKLLWWTGEGVNPPNDPLSDAKNADALEHPPNFSQDHFAPPNGAGSHLRLNVFMGSRSSYSCQLLTYQDMSCSETKEVIFKDPKIEINFDRPSSFYDKSHTILTINVTCNVDASYGTPQIVLSYLGSEGGSVVRLEHGTVTADNKYYFESSRRELLQLPSTGNMHCRVIDERGVYSETSPITTVESVCPDPIIIKLRQPRLAARPSDNITMECMVVGVSSSNVVFYMWTIEEINQPIFTFSDTHKIKEISEGYHDHVLNEDRQLTKHGMTSIITLDVKITNKNTYKCDVKVGEKNCIKTAPIMFQDPKLEISFDEDPLPADEAPDGTITEVICKIDVASGKPQFTLTYEGDKGQNYGLISTVPYKISHGYYFAAHSIAIVRLPDAGKVVCSITDSITTYEISKQIIPRMRDLNAETSLNAMEITIPITLLLAILLVIGFVIWNYKFRSRAAHEKKGFPLLRNLHGKNIAEKSERLPWKWSEITTVARHPRLFVDHEPLSRDIQQLNGAAYDSWFLAALNSLCVSNSGDPSNNYLARVFEHAKDLTASKIPIMIWRFGEWIKVEVTPTLPSKGGQLYFVHSENKKVFWSALLQKAIAMVRNTSSTMNDERDIHLLEDLSGKIVVTHVSNDWEELCHYIEEHRPICCWHLVERSYIFYSITGLTHEETIADCKIILREFPYVSENDQTKYRFPPEKKNGSPGKNDEFFLRKRVFQQYFHEYSVLTSETIYIKGQAVKMLEYTAFDGNGHWQQTKSDIYKYYEKEIFWTNPQYLLEFDESKVPEGQELHVRIILMQKERWPEHIKPTDDDPLRPLRIGIELFQISDSTFNSPVALGEYSTELRPSHFSMPPEVTRKVPCWWSGKSSDRYLVVPFAGGGLTSGDFLLRVHTNNKEALLFKQLPPDEEAGIHSPLLENSDMHQ